MCLAQSTMLIAAEPLSKKGLQVQMVDDALALGIKHAALNVSISALFDPGGAADSFKWQSGGREWFFRKKAVEGITVKPLSDAGVQVNLILLNYAADAKADAFMRPPGAKDAPNKLYGFNTQTPEGIAALQACIEFLADRFSRADNAFGQVGGYIAGNEVNSHWDWYNLGEVPMETVASEYQKALRIIHAAVRKSSQTARVYISLEHHWTVRGGGNAKRYCTGRSLIEKLTELSRAGGDFDWHVAFHPYPENLFEPRTWNDKAAHPNIDSPKITFRNIEQLIVYLRRPEILCNGNARRVILSEQGFHSPDGPDGEAFQAAGFCYAWRKVAAIDGIDAFILHRHVDHKMEGGLRLGLWARKPDSIATPGQKKRIYDVFRAADTPEWASAFEFALPVIGIKSWDEVK